MGASRLAKWVETSFFVRARPGVFGIVRMSLVRSIQVPHLVEELDMLRLALPLTCRYRRWCIIGVNHALHHGKEGARDVRNIFREIFLPFPFIGHGALFEYLGLELWRNSE